MEEADQSKPVVPQERWIGVPGFIGKYEVSSGGRVRSLPRNTASGLLGGKTLSPGAAKNGYLRVSLSSDGKTHRFLLHRLVLKAFVGDCPNGHECRHLDGVRANCALFNLAWGTRSENACDRLAHGTQVDNRGQRHGMTRLSDAQAVEIQRLRSAGVPIAKVAANFHTSIATVSRISSGAGWKHITKRSPT